MLRKLLRLFVMMSIRTPEEVYKTAAKSVGLDVKNMTENEVSAWKASMKCIEAEYLIHSAFEEEFFTKEAMKKICDELSKKIKTKEQKELN